MIWIKNYFPKLTREEWTQFLVSILLAAVLISLSFSAADIAWVHTPDAANFRAFAEHTSVKPSTKFSYLYTAAVLQSIGVIWFALLALFDSSANKKGLSLCIVGCSVFGLLAESIQVINSMSSAGLPPPSPSEILMNVFSWNGA
jgi:hypothetical protein